MVHHQNHTAAMALAVHTLQMHLALFVVVLLSSGFVLGEDAVSEDFIAEPQDATVTAGSTVQLDCELVVGATADICAWRVSGTGLGVDHFYNVFPPSKVRALFPEHERVCSIVIEDVDWRHAGLWTCWPMAAQSHISSRAARLTVSGSSTTELPWPTSTPQMPTTIPTSTVAPTSPTYPSSPMLSTTPAPPTTTVLPPKSTPAPPETSSATPAPSPGPGFQCPQRNGLFADPMNSRYFYVCEDGIAIHLQCEGPNRWDDDEKVCA